MGLNSERYFFLSGLISFFFFLSLLFVIGFSLLSPTKIEQFAMTKSQFVSVSIAIAEPAKSNEPVREQAQPEPQPEPTPQPQEQSEPEPPAPAPVAEISDLFSQVKAQKTPEKPKTDPKRSEALNALEKEVMKSTQTPRMSEKVKNLELVKPSLKMVVQGGSTGPVVNEYHAKIHGLVYAAFHPPVGSAGQGARVIIKISASGKLLSYKVVAYSASTALNSEVDWLKERLGTVVFPPHPEGREAVLEFILTAKE